MDRDRQRRRHATHTAEAARPPCARIARPPPHDDSPYYDPQSGIYDPPLNPTWSPLDFVGLPARPVAGAVGTMVKPAAGALRNVIDVGIGAAERGWRSMYNAYRLRQYLEEARKIPDGISEVAKGVDRLTPRQLETLKDFKRSRSAYKDYIDVLNYSDGRSIFTVKQPAKNIPKSYTVWEQQVDASGETIRLNKVTVGPDGELIHIRIYKLQGIQK